MTVTTPNDHRPPFDRAAHLRKGLDDLGPTLEEPGTVWIPLWRNRNLIASGRPTRPAMLTSKRAAPLVELAQRIVWLGRLGEADCLAVELDPGDETPKHPLLSETGEFNDLRLIGSLLRRGDVELLAYARGMLYWHRHHRFCAGCGKPTKPRQGGHQRICEGCSKEHFPRTDPAIMSLVCHEDRCLLARQASFPSGMYSVLAGFVEPGESLEDAVARETLEEVGLEVTDIRYERSQPWPFPASLMLGFTARAVSEQIQLDDELEDARWFTADQLRSPDGFFIPPPYSLANVLIRRFLAEQDDGE